MWRARHNMANEEHKHFGSRGVNAFQSSNLLSYRLTILPILSCSYVGSLPCVLYWRNHRRSAASSSGVFRRFESTFLEPMSHMILNGLVRPFLSLICDTTNGLTVNGKQFHVPTSTQDRMDMLIRRLQFPSSFNRPACLLRGGCVVILIRCG